MLLPAMRPPLLVTITLSRQEATDSLKAGFYVANLPDEGTISSGHVSVAICAQQRRFFSPSLDLHLYDEPDGARLDGRFGPHPDVWTLHVAVYAVLGAASIGASMLGTSLWMMREQPSVLLALPVLLLLGGLVYLSAPGLPAGALPQHTP